MHLRHLVTLVPPLGKAYTMPTTTQTRLDRVWPVMERKLTTAERTVARWWAIGGIFAVTGGLTFLPWH